MSVPRDQLACLPLPLMPANGFSWNRTILKSGARSMFCERGAAPQWANKSVTAPALSEAYECRERGSRIILPARVQIARHWGKHRPSLAASAFITWESKSGELAFAPVNGVVRTEGGVAPNGRGIVSTSHSLAVLHTEGGKAPPLVSFAEGLSRIFFLKVLPPGLHEHHVAVSGVVSLCYRISTQLPSQPSAFNLCRDSNHLVPGFETRSPCSIDQLL